METKTATVRWNNERVSAYADTQGVVRVYDSVAGHYTVCHSLTPSQVERVRRLTQPRGKISRRRGIDLTLPEHLGEEPPASAVRWECQTCGDYGWLWPRETPLSCSCGEGRGDHMTDSD